MQDRFMTLRQKLDATHIPLLVVDRQGDTESIHRVLVLRTMTVRELREAIMAKFAQEGAKKSDYAVFAGGKQLPLSQTVGTLPPEARITLERVEKQQALDDREIVLVFEDGSLIVVDRIPAIIGRSKDTENTQVEVNLNDFPESLTVSRRHAEIIRNGANFAIRSLSDKPIYVNDAPINPSLPRDLEDGASVRLGKITFHVRIQPKG